MSRWVMSEATALGALPAADGAEVPPRLERLTEQASSLAERLLGACTRLPALHGCGDVPRAHHHAASAFAYARADDLVRCKKPRKGNRAGKRPAGEKQSCVLSSPWARCTLEAPELSIVFFFLAAMPVSGTEDGEGPAVKVRLETTRHAVEALSKSAGVR